MCDLAGAVAVRTSPQEVPWTVPLDEGEERVHVARYGAVAARAASSSPPSGRRTGGSGGTSVTVSLPSSCV